MAEKVTPAKIKEYFMRFKYFILTSIISLLIPTFSFTMEEQEIKPQGIELSSDIPKIIKAITYYKYHPDKQTIIHEKNKDYQNPVKDVLQDTIIQEETEEFENPFVYSIKESYSGGFLLPKGYKGNVTVKEIDNARFIALLYFLTEDKQQFLGIIYSNIQSTFSKIFTTMFERIKNEQITSSVIGIKHPDENENILTCPISNLKRIMGPAHKSHCQGVRLQFNNATKLAVTIDKDTDKSRYSTGTIEPTYFNDPEEPHYADQLSFCILF